MSEKPPMILKYSSPKLTYGFIQKSPPFEGESGSFKIYETFENEREHKSAQNLIGDYRIHIEGSVENLHEYLKKNEEGHDLIEKIEKLWIYICGEPMNPYFDRLIFDPKPERWKTNQKEVHDEMNFRNCSSKYRVEFLKGEQIHWVVLGSFPLEIMLEALPRYEKLKDLDSVLLDLHFESLTAKSEGGRLFSLTKCLELFSKMIPGKNHRERQEQLDGEIKNRMKLDLNTLHNISNNRFNLRHVVSGNSGPSLHKKTTTEERSGFSHDCDILIRNHICNALDLPTPYFTK